MPKEKASLLGMISGDEPGLIARIRHNLSGGDEGDWGEACLAQLLENRAANGAVFQNIYVPTDSGTTELDVVLVHPTGVYVFESKAFGGKIYGNPSHMKWTQYLGGQKFSFYNPIKQNENHCLELSKTLEIPRESMASFIVFENRADLSKVIQPMGDQYTVCNRNRLIYAMKNTIAVRKVRFSSAKITEISTKLSRLGQVDDSAKERHIQQVRERMFGSACPVCGKALVERKGKYGVFIGCSGYPTCRYTREAKQP